MSSAYLKVLLGTMRYSTTYSTVTIMEKAKHEHNTPKKYLWLNVEKEEVEVRGKCE